MNLVPVRALMGLGEIPTCRKNAGNWLRRRGITLQFVPSKGGPAEAVALSDLPAPVRLACVQREIAAAGLAAGTYDDAAHERLAGASAGMRAEAERKAGIARLLVTAGKAMTWPQKAALVRARFGADGTPEPSLMRIAKAVEGVDPINFVRRCWQTALHRVHRARISRLPPGRSS